MKKNNRKILKILIILVTLAFLVLCSFFILPPGFKVSVAKNSFFQNFIHTYHSVRKFPDILFFPYFFRETSLPKIYLNIDLKDIITLNDSLKKTSEGNPFVGWLTDENKTSVKGNFVSGEYKGEVEIRYRGISSSHWNSYQKSYRINFPKEKFFDGVESLNLMIPYDRDYYIEPLNMYRAEKMGLPFLGMDFRRVNLNGQDMGVYLAFEGWSKSWLKKRGFEDSSDVFSLIDAGFSAQKISVFSVAGIKRWKSPISDTTDLSKLDALIRLTANTTDQEFKEKIGDILDLQKFYAWNVLDILAASGHQSDQDNIVIVYNAVTKKLEMVPWDMEIGFSNEVFYENTTLAKRILAVPEFKAERDRLLLEYVNNEKNLEDDLVFFDNLHKNLKADFLSDSAKLYNNFQFLWTVGEIREQIIKNFYNARKVINNTY